MGDDIELAVHEGTTGFPVASLHADAEPFRKDQITNATICFGSSWPNRPDKARRIIEPLKSQPELMNDPTYIALFAAQAAGDGHGSEARRMISQIEQMRKTQYVEPFMLVEVCNVLKDPQQLRLWLRRADEERSTFFVYLHAYAPYWGLDPAVLTEFETGRR